MSRHIPLARCRKARAVGFSCALAVAGVLGACAGRGTAPEPVSGAATEPSRGEARDATIVTSGLTLTLECRTSRAVLGDTLAFDIVVSNTGDEDILVDNGSLVNYPTFHEVGGGELDEWQTVDILAEAPGVEAFWTVPAHGSATVSRTVAFRRDVWTGYGVPDGRYEGPGLVVAAAAGAAVFAPSAVPRTLLVTEHWTADSDTVRDRAERFGLRRVFAGTIASNAVQVELVER